MQIALRRGFGYAYNPLLGMRGMGDMVSDLIAAGVSPADAAAYAEAPQLVSSSPTEGIIPSDVAALQACAADPNCSMPPGVTPATVTAMGLCADGSPRFSDGTCAETSAAPGSAGAISAAAQLAAALSRSIAPTTGIFGGAATSCPAGYVYGTPGASVQIAPGIATVGNGKCIPSTVSTSVIPGVSNTALAFVAVAFLGLMLMGGKRR